MKSPTKVMITNENKCPLSREIDGGRVVSIVAFQVVNPVSILGSRNGNLFKTLSSCVSKRVDKMFKRNI